MRMSPWYRMEMMRMSPWFMCMEWSVRICICICVVAKLHTTEGGSSFVSVRQTIRLSV